MVAAQVLAAPSTLPTSLGGRAKALELEDESVEALHRDDRRLRGNGARCDGLRELLAVATDERSMRRPEGLLN